MKHWKLGAIGILAIAVGMGFAFRGAPAPVTFSGLQTGERLLVDYKMSGCFASERLILSFWRSKGLEVEIHRFVRGADGKEKRVRVGQTTLSKNDERELDNLLRFYRSRPAGGCTTIENVQIAHLKSGKELAKETYVDASCSTNADMLRLGELGRRFTPPKR